MLFSCILTEQLLTARLGRRRRQVVRFDRPIKGGHFPRQRALAGPHLPRQDLRQDARGRSGHGLPGNQGFPLR